MRYPPDQKAKAREAILEAGARTLRANGFNGIGVDGLAAAAGVTSGAFYSNFANKEALLEAVIATRLGRPFVDVDADSIAERREILRQWLIEYISPYHRENPGVGCVMPSLSADVARAGPAVRDAYGRAMTDLIGKISTVLDGSAEDRARRAWSIVAVMIGALEISRAMPDGEESDRAIAAALQTATGLLG
ncbi:MAG: TetR/AcrR family transcriptional regulator [Sphingomonas sp.]